MRLEFSKQLLDAKPYALPLPCQVFKKHGVEQYNPAGEKFDPNLHQAMFEVPDGTKEAGLVAVVTKVI
jgi:molecular chaperone GrpE